MVRNYRGGIGNEDNKITMDDDIASINYVVKDATTYNDNDVVYVSSEYETVYPS